MTSDRVDLDPGLSVDLTDVQRQAVEVHVLRARADGIRGPNRGARGLALALRAAEIEQTLLTEQGVEAGAGLLRDMETHPATVAAIERWRYAQELAERVLREMPD